jgi:hypothetical protein
MWEEVVEELWHIPAHKLFKGRKYFEEFLRKYKNFPKQDELLTFYYNRYICAGKKKTLPFHTADWAKDFIGEYRKVMEENKIDVEGAIKLLDESMPRKNREKIEGSN